MAEDDWQSDIYQKVEELITNEDELVKILFYLVQQEDAADHDYKKSGIWKLLKRFLNNDRAFLACLRKILRDLENGQNNAQNNDQSNEQNNEQSMQDTITAVYNQMCLKRTSGDRPAGNLSAQEIAKCGSIGFAHAWTCISPEAQAKILKALPHLVNVMTLETAKKASALVNALGKKASVVLAAAYLTWEALHNIYRWWNGEISGKRVAKNIIDSLASVGAGIGGGVGGAAIGAFAGPIGAVFGGVIGSIAASSLASIIINMLTEEIFNIPKSEALENAYNFLGVTQKASNEEINKAYHALCLRHHPDKGGSHEMFLKLQSYMGIIKVARGEKY